MPKHRNQTGRSKRALALREPKLVEGDRALLALRGPKASPRGVAAMQFFAGLKKGDARMLTRKNDIRPFEDASSLEFLAQVNNCSAFALASQTKKRPDNVVLVRPPSPPPPQPSLRAWHTRSNPDPPPHTPSTSFLFTTRRAAPLMATFWTSLSSRCLTGRPRRARAPRALAARRYLSSRAPLGRARLRSPCCKICC